MQSKKLRSYLIVSDCEGVFRIRVSLKRQVQLYKEIVGDLSVSPIELPSVVLRAAEGH